MVCSAEDLRRAEPSSDFPTVDDVSPCRRRRAMNLSLVLAGALLLVAIGYVSACARARTRKR